MKIKDEKSFPFLWEFPNSIDKITCELLMEKMESDPDKYQGIIGDGSVDTSIKNSTDSLILGLHWEGYYELLQEPLMKALKETEFLNGCKRVIDSGMQVQKTPTGSDVGYDWHIDHQISPGPDERLWERVVTFIWYLNDDFEGGNTEFNDCFIEPEQGKLLLFAPSTTMVHKGHPPRNGSDKFICTGWLWAPLPLYDSDEVK